MTEAEALDEAAKAAGWLHWKEASGRTWQRPGIRAHAATLMENAALKAANKALKALRDDDGELLTIAWMDGAHRSNKAHREQVAALKAENARLREAMVVMDNTVRELTEALIQIAKPCSVVVEPSGKAGGGWKKMYYAWRKIAVDRVDIARAALKEIEGD